MNLFGIFRSLGSFLVKVFRFAEAHGLSDDIMDLAFSLVTKAQVRFEDSAARREWVVTQLRTNGLSESLARFAVEAAVQAYKAKLRPAPP